MRELEHLSPHSISCVLYREEQVTFCPSVLLQVQTEHVWNQRALGEREVQVLVVESPLIGVHTNGEYPRGVGRPPTVHATGCVHRKY
jgi:hypothetical protein